MTADEREIIVRLYFVDTPEAETAYKDRIAEQAAYFGITPEQAVGVAHEAAAFTATRLAGTFTVWTRRRSALGRSELGRFYGIGVAGGEDLNETLVRRGLARIYGTRTVLFDGRDSRQYPRPPRGIGNPSEGGEKRRVEIHTEAALRARRGGSSAASPRRRRLYFTVRRYAAMAATCASVMPAVRSGIMERPWM